MSRGANKGQRSRYTTFWPFITVLPDIFISSHKNRIRNNAMSSLSIAAVPPCLVLVAGTAAAAEAAALAVN